MNQSFIPPSSSLIPRFIPSLLCVAILFALPGLLEPNGLRPTARGGGEADNAGEVDAALERAASSALGGREGTIIVMDPQNGRLRAVVNPSIAFGQAFPPGSTIKPFTALTALRAGLIDGESRLLCRTPYAHDGFSLSCSHPQINAPFDPAQALAYSCNYYFGKLGERLNEEAFNATLASFGFGTPTGINAGQETAGCLPRERWRAKFALGEGEQLLATPIQLMTAYVALFNGGHLYVPQRAAPDNFSAQERASLSIDARHRAVLLEGMRGAIEYGTAERAHLDALPFDLFGKTGTSTEIKGFRTQGWFVGFAADQSSDKEATPASIRLAVLVFVKHAHGAECALIARPVFEEYARMSAMKSPGQEAITQPRQAEEASAASSRSTLPSSLATVKVHLVSENLTKTITLEEYVLGVLATEASVEDEPEALKAQAVASRTFALKNLGRHAQEGYDFCSTTHCQRYALADDENGRARASASMVRALADTEGEVLRDEHGQLIDAYFHAACGGMTAHLGTLWGAPAPSYLRGVRDDYCATMPHRNWTDVIAASQLAAALQSDSRSNVGARLDRVTVARRDATGRAEMIALEGERRILLRGWDFKMIVGRALGWNVLKSSRFEVRRAGPNFIFRGSGFGHGLGLCQEGAHVMARRGISYRQILNHYFPGTIVERRSDGKKESSMQKTAALGESHERPGNARLLPTAYRFPPRSFNHAPQKRWLNLASENFRVRYPASVQQREVESVLSTLEAARGEYQRRLASASLGLVSLPVLEVIIHQTTGDFTAATGQPWWSGAVTLAARIELQPVAVLRRRGVLTTTIRHEYAHAVIGALGHGRTPRWLAEGLAIHVAGEGAMIARARTETKLSPAEIEQKLTNPASAEEMRSLYAAAYREVRALIRSEGEAGVWRRVARGQAEQ